MFWMTSFEIPGTSIRFGLDGIVGVVPGIGDMIGGIASCIIIIAAWVRGVSYVTVARMVVNVGDRGGGGGDPGVGGHVRHCMAGEPAELCAADGKSGGAAKAQVQSWWFLAALCVVLAVLSCCRYCCSHGFGAVLLGSLASISHRLYRMVEGWPGLCDKLKESGRSAVW